MSSTSPLILAIPPGDGRYDPLRLQAWRGKTGLHAILCIGRGTYVYGLRPTPRGNAWTLPAMGEADITIFGDHDWAVRSGGEERRTRGATVRLRGRELTEMRRFVRAQTAAWPPSRVEKVLGAPGEDATAPEASR